MSRIIVKVALGGSKFFKEILWSSVTIKKSLDDICHSMELILPVSQRDRIHKHDTVRIYYENKHITDNEHLRPVSTVLVDEIKDSVASSQTVTIVGRSPARDLIDSTWSQEYAGSPTLLEITESIAKTFDIKVWHIPTTERGTQAVAGFSFTDESPWTKLLNEAENQGYIFTSNQVGSLYLTKSPRQAEDWGFHLSEEMNIKSIEQTENGAEQFHEYIVKGKGKEVSVTDYSCNNKRVLTISLTDMEVDEEKLRTRAKTEMLRRRENTVSVTVSGWGLNDLQISQMGNTCQKEIFYEPNFLIPVKIPSAGIEDILLTKSVEYTASQFCFESTIELINKEAYYG